MAIPSALPYACVSGEGGNNRVLDKEATRARFRLSVRAGATAAARRGR